MYKKIITTTIAVALFGSIFASAVYASEVTGNLSSSGVSSSTTEGSGQSAGGTISGTVVGGTSTSGGGGGGGGSTTTNGGGGHPIPPATTNGSTGSNSVSGSQTSGVSGSVLGASTENTFVGRSGDGLALANPDDTTLPSDQIAQTDYGTQPSGDVPLAAAAGNTGVSGATVAWIILGLLLLILIIYGLTRKSVKNKNTTPTTTFKP